MRLLRSSVVTVCIFREQATLLGAVGIAIAWQHEFQIPSMFTDGHLFFGRHGPSVTFYVKEYVTVQSLVKST